MPFCFHKCHYCDFYSIVDSRQRQGQFVHRLLTELEASQPFLCPRVRSIFVGGGTPSLLKVDLWQVLLDRIRQAVPFADDLEFTVEVNPETASADLFETLRAGGVNRLSIGSQSFHAAHLKTLERWHAPENVERAMHLARASGIENINLDFIFGIPGQSVEDWADDLSRAVALEPTHLSCYGLMYEPNTPLTQRMSRGEIVRMEGDDEARLYEHAMDFLTGHEFVHYEISNWCRPGFECRHNLAYWTNAQWWPLGPSASGHARGWRWKNVPRLDSYLNEGPFPPIVDAERPDEDARIGEAFMLGLRLINGLSMSEVESLLARGHRALDRTRAIETHLITGLLEQQDDRLRLTKRGLLLADTVLADLI